MTAPRTPEFRRWFRASKIVDAHGEPLVVYHGGFDVLNSRAGAFRRSASGALGAGIYFTPDRSVAEYYAGSQGGHAETGGGALTEVYLSIQNPLVVDHTQGRDPAIEALVLLGEPRARAEAKVERARERSGDVGKTIETAAVKADYDGIIHSIDGEVYEIVAFQPGQVKSATRNAGTYEFFDPDIRRNPVGDAPCMTIDAPPADAAFVARLRVPGGGVVDVYSDSAQGGYNTWITAEGDRSCVLGRAHHDDITTDKVTVPGEGVYRRMHAKKGVSRTGSGLGFALYLGSALAAEHNGATGVFSFPLKVPRNAPRTAASEALWNRMKSGPAPLAHTAVVEAFCPTDEDFTQEERRTPAFRAFRKGDEPGLWVPRDVDLLPGEAVRRSGYVVTRNPASGLDVRPGIPGTYRTTFTDKGGRERAYPAQGGAPWDRTLVRVANETTVASGRVYDTVKHAEHAGHASLRGKRGEVAVTRLTNPRKPDEFEPPKPLIPGYQYRVKRDRLGDMRVAVFYGSKQVANIDAYWQSMQGIEDRDEKNRHERPQEPPCAPDLRSLGAKGTHPNVLAVANAFIYDSTHKGKGIGRAMYQAMLAEGFAVRESRIEGKPGPLFFVPDVCSGTGNTSPHARRVWASLAREYPSAGMSIRVDAPPVIGSRPAPVPATPYDALHAAAGSALRAWMRAKGARVHRLTTEEDLPLASAYVTAVSLLRDAPELPFDKLERMVAGARTGMTNPETYEPVDAQDVLHALRAIRPQPLPRQTPTVRVYHATDAKTAAMLRTRGYVPETKGRSRGEFAPGKGLDAGLYVGASPRAVESYGRVTLEVEVPREWLTVPTELAQLGERDPMRALQEHDGAVVFHALPPEAFREAAITPVPGPGLTGDRVA